MTGTRDRRVRGPCGHRGALPAGTPHYSGRASSAVSSSGPPSSGRVLRCNIPRPESARASSANGAVGPERAAELGKGPERMSLWRAAEGVWGV